MRLPVGLAGAAADALRVYPHPARERLVVEGLTGRTTARLFDTEGREVLREVLHGGAREELDLRSLTSGAYVLQLESATGTVRVPVVRE